GLGARAPLVLEMGRELGDRRDEAEPCPACHGGRCAARSPPLHAPDRTSATGSRRGSSRGPTSVHHADRSARARSPSFRFLSRLPILPGNGGTRPQWMFDGRCPSRSVPGGRRVPRTWPWSAPRAVVGGGIGR